MGVVIAILVFLFMFAFFIFARKPVAFYALLAYTPFNQFILSDLPVHEFPVLVRIAALMGVLASVLVRGRSFGKLLFGNALCRFFLCWVFVVLVAFAASGYYTDWAERSLLRIASSASVFFVFRSWVLNRNRLIKCWTVISWILIANGLMAVAQIATGGFTSVYVLLHLGAVPDTSWEGRAWGLLTGGPNGLGYFLGALIPIEVAFLGNRWPGVHRNFHIVALASGIIGLALSGSRGGAMTIIPTLLLGTFIYARRRLTRILVVGWMAVGIPILIVLLSILSPRLTSVDQEESVTERYLIWSEALYQFENHPILGIGMGNFRTQADFEAMHTEEGGTDAHSLYMQMLAETGVIGSVVFFSMCGLVLWNSYRGVKKYPRGSVAFALSFVTLAFMLSVLVNGLVDFPFIAVAEYCAVFGFMLGCASNNDVIAVEEGSAPKLRKTRDGYWLVPAGAGAR